MTKRPLGAMIMLLLAMIGITIVVRVAGNERAVEIARQFYYLPIIYAGFSFSIYGAVIVSLLAAYLSATHGARMTFEYGTYVTLEEFAPLLQLAMFFVVGY